MGESIGLTWCPTAAVMPGFSGADAVQQQQQFQVSEQGGFGVKGGRGDRREVEQNTAFQRTMALESRCGQYLGVVGSDIVFVSRDVI